MIKMYILTYLLIMFLSFNQPPNHVNDIQNILGEADPGVVDHIHSINVLNFTTLQSTCKSGFDVAGCELSHFNGDGELLYSDIYVYNYETPIKGFNFNNTLSHEMGHVDWAYRMGYGSNTEGYANRYAEEKGHPR